MLVRLKGIYRDEGGQILPIFAVMLVVLLGISALVIDGGRMYQLKNETYNIAEASALATEGYLGSDTEETVVRDVAMKYALSNGAKEEEVTITFDYTANGDKLLDSVTVKVSKENSMIFGNLISDADGKISGQYTVPGESDNLTKVPDMQASFAE